MTGRSVVGILGRVRSSVARLLPGRAEQAAGALDSQAAGPDERMLRRARWGLVAWSAGATLVVLVLLGAALYAAVASSLAATDRAQLEARLDMVRRFVEGGPSRPGGPQPPIGFSVGGPAPGTFAYIVGPDGTVLGPPEFSQPGLPDDASVAGARQGRTDVRDVSLDGTPLRVLSEAVTVRGSPYVVQVAVDVTNERRTLDQLLTVLLIGGFAAVAGSAAVGWVYARRALVPIRESLRRQREFAADASHELRTPLSVIQTGIQRLERHPDALIRDEAGTLTDIRDEVAHLAGLVGDLLLLARTDSGVIEVTRAPLDLADVAGEALMSLSALAEARRVRLVLDPEPAPVLGDPQRLRQLVTILADNAIAHSPDGGTVRVRVRREADRVTLDVEDDGSGIRPEHLGRVFDRFWRAPDAPKAGTGLGLAIAAWIVERHGGSIAATNRDEGGARFSARLPAAP